MEETISTMLKDIQNRLFELMDTLRTDYHQSNKELKELQERAKKGENVMPILLEMISPERVALPKISQEEIEEERRLYEALPKLGELLGHSKR